MPGRNVGKRNLRTLLVNGKDPYKVSASWQKRNPAQKEQDLAFIAERYLKGMVQEAIVEELNTVRYGLYSLGVEQIREDIEVIHKRWMTSYLVDFDAVKSRELAHIDMLEMEYWNAWRRSMQKVEEVESEQIKDTQSNQRVAMPSYSRSRVKKSEKNRDGNVKFLEGVQWCIEQRMKIFGLAVITTNQNINVSWRKEAEAQGIDPDGVQNDLIEQFLNAASTNKPTLAGTGDAGGMGESTEDPT